MAVGAQVLQSGRANSFGAKSLTEILHSIQPGLCAAIQAFQNGCELIRNFSGLVLSQLAPRPIQEESLEVVIRKLPTVTRR